MRRVAAPGGAAAPGEFEELPEDGSYSLPMPPKPFSPSLGQ